MGPLSSAQDTSDLHPITGHVLHCCKEIITFRNIYARISSLSVSFKNKKKREYVAIILQFVFYMYVVKQLPLLPPYGNVLYLLVFIYTTVTNIDYFIIERDWDY